MATDTVKHGCCGARLLFAAGGHKPRFCGQPAKFVLGDGALRCFKHARGRGTPYVKPPTKEQRTP